MSAPITYSLPTSTTTFARSRAELDAFFAAMRVASATLVDDGVAKQCASVSYTPFADYSVDDFVTLPIVVGGVLTNYTVPQQATFEELRTKVQAINDFIVDFKTKLQAAGLLAADA